MNFQLLIKDYDTLEPLKDKQIEMTNIDSKETLSNTTNNKGEVVFTIKESERGDFFNVNLINDDDYEQNPYFLAKEILTNPQEQQTIKQTTQKIFTPNSYVNHTAVIYFKAQVSLYFNGTTLCIMKDKKSLAYFNARSGKSLTQEEKIELEQQGYKSFVDSINSGFICDSISYFCLDKKWQEQKDKGAIPEGEYYIKPNEIDKRTTCIQENTFGINTRIYTDKECTNVVESNTNRDNFYLHGGDKFGNAGGIDVASNDCDFFTTLCTKIDPTQEVIKLQVAYPKKLESIIEFIFQSDDELERDKDYLDINTPFAPGSYVELQTIADNTQTSKASLTLQWAFTLLYNQKDVDSLFTQETLHTYTFYPLLDSNQIKQQEHNVRVFENDTGIDTTKLGFSLPLIREYEDSAQCFIIVFAFENTKAYPNITDPYKIIDMSFKVGLDSNGSVMESKREEQSLEQNNIHYQTSMSNLKAWNTLQCICDVKEAVDFLRANKNKLDEFYQNNQARYNKGNSLYDVWFDYFRIYPSLAGKIAYIYYRFDVGDEKFVEGVAGDNREYVRDRGKFINAVKWVCNKATYKSLALKKEISFIEAYQMFFNNKTNAPDTINSRKDFIRKLIETLCDRSNFNLPLNQVIFQYEDLNEEELNVELNKVIKNTSISNGYYFNKTITLNMLPIVYGGDNFYDIQKHPNLYQYKRDFLSKYVTFRHLLNTIFHEIRHFYIKEKYKGNDSSILKQYIHWSNWFYINTSIHPIIFDKFNKSCVYSNMNNVGCTLSNNQNAYEIQPNERDPRYVAHQIVKELRL